MPPSHSDTWIHWYQWQCSDDVTDQVEQTPAPSPAAGDPQDPVEVVTGGEHCGAVDAERQPDHEAVEDLADDAVGVAGLDHEEVDGGVEDGSEQETDERREKPAQEDPASLGPVHSFAAVSDQSESFKRNINTNKMGSWISPIRPLTMLWEPLTGRER